MATLTGLQHPPSHPPCTAPRLPAVYSPSGLPELAPGLLQLPPAPCRNRCTCWAHPSRGPPGTRPACTTRVGRGGECTRVWVGGLPPGGGGHGMSAPGWVAQGRVHPGPPHGIGVVQHGPCGHRRLTAGRWPCSMRPAAPSVAAALCWPPPLQAGPAGAAWADGGPAAARCLPAGGRAGEALLERWPVGKWKRGAAVGAALPAPLQGAPH